MISGRLTMRATVERNQATANDSWGGDVAPDFQPIGTLNCFVWSRQSRENLDGEKTTMVEDMRAMFALKADINENDEIASVTDRQGNVLIPGRLRVEGPVQHKHTHLKAALKRIG